MSAKNETQKSFSLAGQSRESSRVANEALKKENKIPAVIYGKDFANVNISIKLTEFEKVYREAKKSSFIDLVINEKETYKVLCNSIQIDYTGKIIHADFYKVNEKEEITAEISLNFIGEAPAKKFGFNILLQTTAIKVKCLPKNLVSSLDVD
ncbi:MAG: 50S ribosomal protein L25, partial [Patescibacteria group bacterium]